MSPVLLFEDRVAFASFMMKHLEQSLGLPIEQDRLDPLRLYVQLDKNPTDRQTIYLQNAYDEYRYYGDLNASVHYLNMLTAAYRHVMGNPMKLQVDKLIPVIRSEEYVEDMKRDGNDILHYDSYEGLRTILLEVHDGYSSVVNKDMLKQLSGWTPDKLLKKAVSNLLKRGWINPSGLIVKEESTIGGLLFEVDHFNYQFMLPQYRKAYLYPNYYIAFPNKGTAMVFVNSHPIHKVEDAKAIMLDNQISHIVETSFRAHPHPLSSNIYWVRNGLHTLINCNL